MDLNDIKKFISDSSERFIIIENGKPALVIMGFEAYQSLKSGKKAETRPDSLEMINANLEMERIKARELAARTSVEEPKPRPEPVEMPMMRERDPMRVRLEDLPL